MIVIGLITGYYFLTNHILKSAARKTAQVLYEIDGNE